MLRAPVSCALLASLLAVGACAAPIAAQPPVTRSLPRSDSAGRICSAKAPVVAVRVIDRQTEAPVTGATITATRTRTGVRLTGAGPMGPPGDYLVAEDGGVEGLTRAGEPLLVEVRLGSRSVRAEYVIGLTEDGCHVELRSGPKSLRL